MIDQELFNLCREVYEKTGWDDDFDAINKNGEKWDKDSAYLYSDNYVPLYTSDYLLEKLPAKIKDYEWLAFEKRKDYYTVSYGMSGGGYAPDDYMEWHMSDTPLKALLKLTLKLIEEGVEL